MVEREPSRHPDLLPAPTPRQLVVRAIGTLAVVVAVVAGTMVYLNARGQPAGVPELVRDPRTVSYGRLSLQIPADWKLAALDDCGHVQDDTLLLGLAGVVGCDEGARNPQASAVVMSSLTGAMAAPAPRVRLRTVTLPSGLRGDEGTTTPRRKAAGGGDAGGGSGGGDAGDGDGQPALRTTVLHIPSLDAQVVATSPDQKLVKRILESAKRVPADSPATRTVAYLKAALDVPTSWQVNAVRCGIPTADTVIAGHPGKPRNTDVAGGSCPVGRPPGVTDVTFDSLGSDFTKRWGALAGEPVTLLGGVKAVRGTKQLPSGLTVTVVVVPALGAIAVARSTDQALVNTVLSTVHEAVPAALDRDASSPTTPTPQPTSRPTLPAGLKTRTLRTDGVALALPTSWSEDDQRCGQPQSNTVLLGAPTSLTPGCEATRPAGVSDIVIDRLYGNFGTVWQEVATRPITLPSDLSGLVGTTTTPAGLPLTVLAFPSLDVIMVATAADDGDALDLIEGILTTTRATG